MALGLILFVLIALGLYLYATKMSKKCPMANRKNNEEEEEKVSFSSKKHGEDLQKFYTKQKVDFVEGSQSYDSIFKEELESNNPHFYTLRKKAVSEAKGKDFFGIHLGEETWLFPVSQKHLKELYSMTNLGGKMASFAFNQAVGYAPRAIPFMETNEHWKEVRKSLAAIFHSDFMDAYLDNFNTVMKELVQKWKKSAGGEAHNIKQDICNTAYDSAVLCLTGNKLDVDVPFYSEDGKSVDIHVRDVNTKTLMDFAKHAANSEFTKDNEYRLKSQSQKIKSLNKNLDTLGGALTGVVENRVAEITNGSTKKKTIVDAAFGLVAAGILKDVNEAVQNGWAVLNGAHNVCGNALAAALYYLLQNRECLDKLRKEIQSELINGQDLDENTLHTVVDKEKLKELEYLNCVVKEALRLSSPLYGKPMRATEDIKLSGGFELKKGTVVYANNAVVGVSENIWKDPLKFIPERFDPESPYFKLPDGSKRDALTTLAFGAGPRACMGDNFSLYFIKAGLVYILHHFDLEIEDVPDEEGFFYWLNDKTYMAKVKTR